MQRPSSSTKNFVIDLMQKSQGRLMNNKKKIHSYRCSHGDLPLYHHSSNKKEASGSKLSVEKWVHIIPLIVLLCIFVLWWFSYTVDIEIKGGRVSVIRQMEIPRTLNETRFDFAILATAFPPYSSFSHSQTMEDHIAVEPAGKIG
ncbi:hypothetical protein LIER_28554 [Lithospermum erythrorhizon]|uniref:Transmembrane protein n=1 Tax=Lithospermum erythrorhizon TaxID=34254 RepID=A0AAV3RKA9_LITER